MLGRKINLAFRNLRKEKTYSLLNLFGLAFGLAASLLLMYWVKDELSFDRFHSKGKDMFLVYGSFKGGDAVQTTNTTPAPMHFMGLQQLPELEAATLTRPAYEFTQFSLGDKVVYENNSAYVTPSFFTEFDFKMLKGNPKKPFTATNSVVLTKDLAERIFGGRDPIGEVVLTDQKKPFTVSGVIDNFPSNSSIQFQAMFSMDQRAATFGGNGEWKTIQDDWGNFEYTNYFRLKPGADVAALAKKLDDMLVQNNKYVKAGMFSFALQPLQKMHLYRTDGGPGLIQNVKIFSLVALVLLLIACINYVNLATARATRRAKEVSVRKVIGATRGQLVGQFFLESALLLGMSFLLALILIVIVRPFYETLTAKQLHFDFMDPQMWFLVAGAFGLALAAVGIYPALFLSKFEPALALKGKFSFGGSNKGFRNVLVVGQFVCSMALIVSTMVIGAQLNYIRDKDLGFNKEHVITLVTGGMFEHLEAVKNELKSTPGVVDVASMGDDILNTGNSTGDTNWEGKDPNKIFIVHSSSIDANLMPMMKMKLAEGEIFTGAISDSSKFILNETAIREAGIKDPIGKKFTLWQTEGTIIGVVKDFHNLSIHQKIEPMVFYYQKNNWRLHVKTTGNDAPKVIAKLEQVWKRYNAGYPFDYKFLDQSFNDMYQAEQRTGKLFNAFAVVAILVSGLGLFGLATYIAERRTKEIGIRKVLGATVDNLVMLQAKDFIRLIVIAIVLAIPLSWWMMNNWLKNFAYRVDLTWYHFVLAGGIVLIAALLTVSAQSMRAALSNPVKALRSE
jgi:putative ABC transport system permease protein